MTSRVDAGVESKAKMSPGPLVVKQVGIVQSKGRCNVLQRSIVQPHLERIGNRRVEDTKLVVHHDFG